jgi:BAI1-associated protein 3
VRRRHVLNRRGSLHHNQFKGVKKDLIEKHASLIIHTLTVIDDDPFFIGSNASQLLSSFILQIEELYEEVLYEIIHNVGSDESKLTPEKTFEFMQEAFKLPEDTHSELLEKAKIKEPPELRLNIEIIEAKDLNSKDPNGLADPFVTLYIASAPNTRYTSSVKSGTLNPKYEEHFSL